MHEYVDRVISQGIFIDPLTVYALTPQEINAVLAGVNEREKQLQTVENMRIGTLCASLWNCKRTKHTDKWFKWTDFFSDGKEPQQQSVEEMKAVAKRIYVVQNALEAQNGRHS